VNNIGFVFVCMHAVIRAGEQSVIGINALRFAYLAIIRGFI